MRIRDQFLTANNLTDRLAALQLLASSSAPAKTELVVQALKEWINEPLLINKWLTIQATAPCYVGESPVVERVAELVRCNFFSMSNPNNVYALLVAFFMNNPSEFHRADGAGYKFWAELLSDP